VLSPAMSGVEWGAEASPKDLRLPALVSPEWWLLRGP